MLNGLNVSDNGFKVAPRKPHRAPARKKGLQINNLMPTFKEKLQEQEQVMLTEFVPSQVPSVKQYATTLRGQGWQVKSIKKGKALIGFKLDNKVKKGKALIGFKLDNKVKKREMRTATGQEVLEILRDTGMYRVADFEMSRKYLTIIITDIRGLGYEVTGVMDGAFITHYKMSGQ